MVQYKDFSDYMESNYLDEIMKELQCFIISHKDSFESDEILYVKWIELSDAFVKGVTFKDLGNNKLEIRTSIEAEVDIQGKGRCGYESFAESGIYNVFFEAKLENGLHNVRITEVTEYDKNVYDRDKSLSQNLVPYMYEEDVDKHAENFLQRYCPEALLQPMQIPVYDIVTKMGMRMYYAPMEEGVFGKTYFGEEYVKVYSDFTQQEVTEITTTPGTILINPNVFFMYNVGTANNTIIHECVHWDRHRRPFELQRLLQGEYNHISCEVVETYSGMGADADALKWMEWQANQLAPRILMPAKMTICKMESLQNKLYAEFPEMREAERFEKAVEELAQFFQVSVLAAKIRLVELGYDQAQGVRVYSNEHYLPPFSFPKGTLKVDQTFVIDEKNAVYVIFMNPMLRNLFFEGKIVYANSMVCLNTPKYIEASELDYPILTDYALEHVNECCFIFNRKYSGDASYSDTYYRRCFLCRDINSETFIEAEYDPENKDNQSKEQREAELSKVVTFSKGLSELLQRLPGGFGQTLREHMKRKDINEEELSDRSHLSTVTISKYLNHEEENRKYENVLAICIGLNLHPVLMEDLLAKAGYAHRKDSTHLFIKFLIYNHSNDTIDEWQKKIDEGHVNLKLPQKK